jgi:hypothetical protein
MRPTRIEGLKSSVATVWSMIPERRIHELCERFTARLGNANCRPPHESRVPGPEEASGQSGGRCGTARSVLMRSRRRFPVPEISVPPK